MIGNPKIVDATAQDDRTVVLTPHAVGETNIIFLDERNVRVTSINVLVEEGAASKVKIYNKSWSLASQCTDARKTGASTSKR